MTITTFRSVDVGQWITTRERVRTMRMRRHLRVAALGVVALGFLIPATDTVLEASLVPILVTVVLQSIARGINAGFGYLWGWVYPEPARIDLFDRLLGKPFGWSTSALSTM